ncbi:MAG: VWA domain-containing protein [Planctomycetes bacterium]|nr:VWA domain-containing protein [Planctomycetota bacterium]
MSFEDLIPADAPASPYSPAAVPRVAAPVVQPSARVVAPLPSFEPLPALAPITEEPTTAAAPIVVPPSARAPRSQPARQVEAPVFEESGPVTTPAPPSIPAPHATLALQARFERSTVPGDDPPLSGLLLEIRAAGRPLRAGVQGPVAHVILALDVSASMNAKDKFPVLRQAVTKMLDDLRAPGAAPVLVSFVVFARGAAVISRDTLASETQPDPLFDAIRRSPLCFTNYTDVAGALDRAGRIAYDWTQRAKTLPVRIYLMTDGRPQDMPAAQAAADRCGRVGCDMNAMAFGADADVRVLQDLFAGRRGGTVKSVRKETIGDAFERIAEVAQRVVATRCSVHADLAPGVVGGAAFRYRPARVRFPEPAFEGSKRFHADLGTIENDRTYSLLFEVRPPETMDPVSDLGTITVRIPSFGGPVESTIRLRLPRTPPGSPPGDEDREVRAARDILDALDDSDPQAALRALRLRRTLYEAERRDPGLLSILDRAIELLETTGSLAGLSAGEHATLLAHTCTSGADGAAGGSKTAGRAPVRGSRTRR